MMRDFGILPELIQTGLFLFAVIYLLLGFIFTTREGFISFLVFLPCAVFLYGVYKRRSDAKRGSWGK